MGMDSIPSLGLGKVNSICGRATFIEMLPFSSKRCQTWCLFLHKACINVYQLRSINIDWAESQLTRERQIVSRKEGWKRSSFIKKIFNIFLQIFLVFKNISPQITLKSLMAQNILLNKTWSWKFHMLVFHELFSTFVMNWKLASQQIKNLFVCTSLLNAATVVG